jgi:hypothetical protein
MVGVRCGQVWPTSGRSFFTYAKKPINIGVSRVPQDRMFSAIKPYLPALAVQVLPLLNLMNEELGLDLSLIDLEKRLNDQVKQ